MRQLFGINGLVCFGQCLPLGAALLSACGARFLLQRNLCHPRQLAHFDETAGAVCKAFGRRTKPERWALVRTMVVSLPNALLIIFLSFPVAPPPFFPFLLSHFLAPNLQRANARSVDVLTADWAAGERRDRD